MTYTTAHGSAGSLTQWAMSGIKPILMDTSRIRFCCDTGELLICTLILIHCIPWLSKSQKNSVWFFFIISINLLNYSFCTFIVLLILFNWLFLHFLIGHWPSLTKLFLVLCQTNHRSLVSLRLVTEKLLCFFGDALFSWVLMFLEAIHCLRMRRSSYLL